MKALIQQVWLFIKSDFNWTQYLSIACLLVLLVAVNYFFFPIELRINRLPAGMMRSSGFFVLYSVVYYLAIVITLSAKKRLTILQSRRFWLLSVMAITVFSFDSGFWLPQFLMSNSLLGSASYSYFHSLLANGKGLLTISGVLLVINYFFVPNRLENLGVNSSEINFKPFFIILLLLAPFILTSGIDSGLGNYYPTFKYSAVADTWHSPKWVPVIAYELIYGLDFFNVELFFRGFLIIGLFSILGKDSILPMVAFYCTIHFGKPLAECVSSIFGGFILGIITIQTRSVWGGVALHIGVAWLMEIGGFLAHEFF